MIYFSNFDGIATIPAIDANYAYVANLDTDQLYYIKSATAPVAPASITKLMTALVVLQEKAGALSDTATVSSTDISSTASFTQANLQAGDVISYEDLLYAMMLPSGSEASQTAGRAIGDILAPPSGGLSAFVAEMNSYAASLGMVGTVFTNTFADDDGGAHYSTAADLWRLLKAATDDATLAVVIGSAVRTAVITGANARHHFMATTNPILEDRGVLGGKTGTYAGHPVFGTIFSLVNEWIAPSGDRIGIVTMHSSSTADRQADQRAIIAQLPIDYPALAASIAPANGAGTVLLENNTDRVLLEDNASALLLEG